MRFLKLQLNRSFATLRMTREGFRMTFFVILNEVKNLFSLFTGLKKLKARGDALILTMFIMAGMLIVAMGGSYVMLLGIKAAGVQSQSTKAYYAAEAGAEQLLYKFRHSQLLYGSSCIPSFKNGFKFICSPNSNGDQLILTGTLPGDSDASYEVYYLNVVSPVVFNSVGEYKNSKRSVQIRIGN